MTNPAEVPTEQFDTAMFITDEAQLLHTILQEVKRVRESQERTEQMVKTFVEAMEKNPMLKAMAGRFG